MIGTTNFLIFNEEMGIDLTMSDSNYLMATQRLRGVTPGIASPQLHNKLFRQLSAMSVGMAYWINDCGYDCYDYDIPGIKNNFDLALVQKITANIDTHNDDPNAHDGAIGGIITVHNNDANAHAAAIAKHNNDYSAHSVALNFWQKSRVYALGDVIYPKVHGTPFFLVCTQAGSSGTSEPVWVFTEGAIVSDSGVKWKVSVMSADGGGLNLLKRSTAYEVGDIAYSKYLPSWARLECVQAGTTANVEPQWTNILGGG